MRVSLQLGRRRRFKACGLRRRRVGSYECGGCVGVVLKRGYWDKGGEVEVRKLEEEGDEYFRKEDWMNARRMYHEVELKLHSMDVPLNVNKELYLKQSETYSKLGRFGHAFVAAYKVITTDPKNESAMIKAIGSCIMK
eukprot:TRINITY_DN1334_c0_g1_i1.p1 TRINITY_DN1334_c0_g1~~TRINITY_DN1334_c0_g1_i1.p1  ORF type:complete len:138 (-),score=29.98 TRINITY_DN1334_c0_g1_i1:197-610(-)